ncbi:MAG TPA: DUF1330 domain-containing protein [Devosia sp.]|nr:DUF1330 domain-containing protein [Devosia sp.]
MAKGYWVVNLRVDDPDAYVGYQKVVGPFLAANGGRFVVRGGRQIVPEGTALPRTVVVEFDSFADAERAYYSDAYQAAMQTRLSASSADFVIVEGYEG